jgi:hypothetical protein
VLGALFFVLGFRPELSTKHKVLNFSEHLRWFTEVAGGRGDYGFGVDVDLFTLLERPAHIVFADK